MADCRTVCFFFLPMRLKLLHASDSSGHEFIERDPYRGPDNLDIDSVPVDWELSFDSQVHIGQVPAKRSNLLCNTGAKLGIARKYQGSFLAPVDKL